MPAQHDEIIPTPQYLEPLEGGIALSGRDVRIELAPEASPKVALAASILKGHLEVSAPSLRGRVEICDAGSSAQGGVIIRLVCPPFDERAAAQLNLLDRQVLDGENAAQAYILRSLDQNSVLLAGQPQGILWGVSTLRQCIKAQPDAYIPGLYVRDFPSIQERIAAGWLLNGEANRWSYDRGKGLEAYEALCLRKLDQCLLYKINAVMFDGFGFGLVERFPAYPALMRRLNRHARARGIRLIFGGYGSGFGMAYQKGPLFEDARYFGTVFRNRSHYPDGPEYRCLGYHADKVRQGIDAATLGTCRSNDSLNGLKAAELTAFVEAVEPGGLYIHGEDYGGFDSLQKFWLQRCAQCRARWPNDNAAATDGGAGGIAHGYARLVEAINSVTVREGDYRASRDCLVLLTSPVYTPSSDSSADWSKALTHWQNIARALPKAENVFATFREVFPQPCGGASWIEAFTQAMRETGRPLPACVYFLSGGDHWCNDYPFVATPAQSALFRGAAALYSACGSAYQEPQQLFNAECAWNLSVATACLGSSANGEPQKLWLDLLHRDARPERVFGAGGFLERACAALYGTAVAAKMTRYFSNCEVLTAPESLPASPDLSDKVNESCKGRAEFLPMGFTRVFGVPVQWRRIALDSRTWEAGISNERYLKHFQDLGISRAELHARSEIFWTQVKAQTEVSLGILTEALEQCRPEACADLNFLIESAHLSILLCRALIPFHAAKRILHAGADDQVGIAFRIEEARHYADKAAHTLRSNFPRVSDPSGAELGEIARRLEFLRATLGALREQGAAI